MAAVSGISMSSVQYLGTSPAAPAATATPVPGDRPQSAAASAVDADMFIRADSTSAMSATCGGAEAPQGAIDRATGGDELLKMMLTLLLLGLLLGQDPARDAMGAMVLAALAEGGATEGSSSYSCSETLSVQIAYASGSQAASGTMVDLSA